MYVIHEYYAWFTRDEVGIFHQGLIAKPCHHMSKDRLMKKRFFLKKVVTVY